MAVLLTDIDAAVCAWLEQLVADDMLIGEVRHADIRDLPSDSLRGYDRVHLFAGIGGWELALRLADWPDDLPVWTGSCPCQPFSVAGRQKGTRDRRHLWPDMRRHIEECRPPLVFGEQVAGPAGRQWLAFVRSDLERLGYAVGVADLPAASVGAPHLRQRLWWGAVLTSDITNVYHRWGAARSAGNHTSDANGCDRWPAWTTGADWLETAGWWPCADGKARPFEVRIRPVGHAVPGRAVLVRGAGNAIVPQVGATFAVAFVKALKDLVRAEGTNPEVFPSGTVLQSFLEARLRDRLHTVRTSLFDLTWSHWDMPSGPPVPRLRASVRRHPGSASCGKKPMGSRPRPTIDHGRDSRPETAPWATVTATEPGGTPDAFLGRKQKSGKMGVSLTALSFQVWPTSTVADATGGHLFPETPDKREDRSDPTVPTQKPPRLNPEFCLWLMGYPGGWFLSGQRAMTSFRTSGHRSRVRS